MLKKGKGTTKCTSCQQDIEVELPIDRFNHEGSYANNVWSCCNENLQNKTVFNYPANTNWITNNFILGVMNGNADWTITADIDMIRTNGENDPARGWAGQVQVEMMKATLTMKTLINGFGDKTGGAGVIITLQMEETSQQIK